MSEITVRRRRKTNSLHGWLLWFALTAAFALMGVSMAAYQGGLFISGTAITGECFAIITDAHLSFESLADRDQSDSSLDSEKEPASDSYTHQVAIVTDDTGQGNGTGNNPEKPTQPSLRASSVEGKRITVSIVDAYPGDVYKLQYRVINEGTVPLEFNLVFLSENPQLKVDSSFLSVERLNSGEHCDEELLITVCDNVAGQKNFNFSVELNYSQWKGD